MLWLDGNVVRISLLLADSYSMHCVGSAFTFFIGANGAAKGGGESFAVARMCENVVAVFACDGQ